MEREKHWQQMLKYEPEAWRADETSEAREQRSESRGQRSENRGQSPPDVWEQTRVLELLGRVNYKIIKGNRVYVEVGGVVYKTLYGGYWRSVFTGIEHYLLRCEQVSGSVWAEDEGSTGAAVDLPVSYSNEGWTASGHSLSFMLSRGDLANSRQQSAISKILLSAVTSLKRRSLSGLG
ncbi:MAG: hypothetical protein AABN95_07570 [Acidobacteriota bacterium]